MRADFCIPKLFLLLIAIHLSAEVPSAALADGKIYDLVLKGGRVIDPESQLDAVRDVGISFGKIETVSEVPLNGKTTIDARGLVVGPGFIDLHTHAVNVPSLWMQAFDGVTTALELELGAFPIKKAYAHAADMHLPLNYGFSASWAGARLAVADGVTTLQGTYKDMATYFNRPNWSQLLPEDKSREVVELVENEMLDGGLGIGIVIGYAPKTNREEYLKLGQLAARYDVPTYTHLRSKNTREPAGAVEGFLEVIAVAAATGAQMHICHINSTALQKIVEILPLIEKGEKNNLKITTEAYPWGAGSTVIGAPFLRPDQLSQVGLKASDIMYVKTGERPKDNNALAAIQSADPGGVAVVHYLDEHDPLDMQIIDTAMLSKDTMIASDAIPYQVGSQFIEEEVWPIAAPAYAHPRSAATFTSAIERYVKETKKLSLMEIFRRGSLLPAQLLASATPQARLKGRIQSGMDADIVVMNLEEVEPRANYENPRLQSRGMRYVLVNGEVLIDNGVLHTEVRAGRPLRSALTRIGIQ